MSDVEMGQSVEIDATCVHCDELVIDASYWVHAHRAPDGSVHPGMSRCQSPDVAYGHLAHPADVPCRADGPNPCLGATKPTTMTGVRSSAAR